MVHSSSLLLVLGQLTNTGAWLLFEPPKRTCVDNLNGEAIRVPGMSLTLVPRLMSRHDNEMLFKKGRMEGRRTDLPIKAKSGHGFIFNLGWAVFIVSAAQAHGAPAAGFLLL